MASEPTSREILRPGERLVMIVGGFGSGKTEVAVNLAVRLAAAAHRIQVADLDLVNPYFRCREARRLMQRHGIRVVIPPGAQAWADLPIVMPEIRGMLHPPEGTVSIFDVGGDDVGATVLGAFRTSLQEGDYQLWQVINSRRPFTDTVGGCLEMLQALQRVSRLKVTGLLANSHLIEQSMPETVLEGWRLAEALSAKTGLPVRCVAVEEHLVRARALGGIDAPVLPLRRHMLPPWLETGSDVVAEATHPAPRPVPIGRPGREPEVQGGADGQDRH